MAAIGLLLILNSIKMKNKTLFFILGIILVSFVGSVSALAIGDKVQVSGTGGSGLLVLSPNPCSSSIGGKLDGSQGTIIDGPQYCSGYYRYKVSWTDGLVGWSAQDWLIKISTQTCTNQCSSGQTQCLIGGVKQTCVYSNGCYVWGGGVSCTYGCAYGQCLTQPTCVPNCNGKTCGDNGCGGSCGVCQGSLPTLEWPLPGSLGDRQPFNYFKFGSDWTFAGNYPLCGGTPKKHIGLDIKADSGENVYASYSGTVRLTDSVSSTYPAWAKSIVIDSSTFTITYMHINPSVSVGDYVTKGQKIATVADITSSGSANHLHFEVRNSPYNSGDKIIDEAGALPNIYDNSNSNCYNYPLFPENFVDPLNLNYDSNPNPIIGGYNTTSNITYPIIPVCTKNSDCGIDSYTGNKYCVGSSVRQIYKTNICTNNQCSASNNELTIQTCQNGCNNGVCNGASSCTPNCNGKTCGDNGCGGSCGVCSSGTCSNGLCTSQSTGTNQCSSGQTRCNGQFSETCISSSNGWIWGNDVNCQNGCRGNGFCNLCVPNSQFCQGNSAETCSSDGSSLSGITCGNGQTCNNGVCQNSASTSGNNHNSACSFITNVQPAGTSFTMNDYVSATNGWITIDANGDGKKELFGYIGGSLTNSPCPADNIYWHTLSTTALGGLVLKYFYASGVSEQQLMVCSGNSLAAYSTTRNLPSNPDTSCTASCVPSCSGKTCGDNGCGGSCGVCSSTQTCSNGQCTNPTPSCTNQCTWSATNSCVGQNSDYCFYNGTDGCYEWAIANVCSNGCSGAGICNVCIPNTRYCSGNYAMMCNSDGSATSGVLCGTQETCQNGFCNYQFCVPNSKYCDGNYLDTCGSDGSSATGIMCSNGCSNGACVNPIPIQPSCTNQCTWNTNRCNGQNSEYCFYNSSDGCYEWSLTSVCSSGCRGTGICNSCVPNSKYCDGNSAATCSSDGQSSYGQLCASGKVCSNGTCIASAPKCKNQCTLNQNRCNGKNSETCKDANGDGCTEWSVKSVCASGCSGTGVCNVCVPNSKFCQGNYAETCNSKGTGASMKLCTGKTKCTSGVCK